MYRLVPLLLALAACPEEPPIVPHTDPVTTDEGTSTGDSTSPASEMAVTITLDGTPVEGALLIQGGGTQTWTTDAAGTATVTFDFGIPGDQMMHASHPEARIEVVKAGPATATIALTRFDPSDNEAYTFQDPGTPTDNATTAKCAHCHVTLVEDWYGSPHRTSASSDRVQDLYAGAAAAHDSAAACATAGGQWWQGVEPGTGQPTDRCYLGAGALPALNPSCGTTGPCDDVATAFGGCADCHAPGIDGVLGGRDLLDATGLAYDYGVHCDVCHKIESVDLAAPAGVAGRLNIVRPSEPDPSPVEEWEQLMFGPYPDVGNPRMGAVVRPFGPEICSGCHLLEQPVLVPGASADPTRWPTGLLPIHTTFEEWRAGPKYPYTPCAECHLPPDDRVGNSADLYNEFPGPEGLAAGWPRSQGAVRRHVWRGPRSDDTTLLTTAATLQIGEAVAGGELVATVTVRNAESGHAIPTGEPLRSVLLVVRATCGGTELVPTGGDVVPDYGGYAAAQGPTGDWSRWPGAQVGDVVRVIQRTAAWRDYVGHGPFGDGTFDAAAKGVAVDVFVGASTITGMAGDVATFDAPLPAGTIAYRVAAPDWPGTGDPGGWAGAPGYGFARVLTDDAGTRMVPHFAATDVASDQRLLPEQEWTTTHTFASPCGDPEVTATLVHRSYPLRLARERGWAPGDRVMATAVQ